MRILLAIVGSILLLVGVVWAFEVSGTDDRPGEARAIEALKTLPYVTWTEVDEEDRLKNGVVRHDPERAGKGLNLYSSENEPGAFLIDRKSVV